MGLFSMVCHFHFKFLRARRYAKVDQNIPERDDVVVQDQ